MTLNPNPNTPDTAPEMSPEQEPFIPPNIMLWLAALGIVVALIVRLASPSFNVVGWGALAFTVIAIVAWVFLAPEQAREMVQGRALRFGGVAILVTVLFLAALMFAYGFVKERGWRTDLTQSEQFTLTEQSREAMRIIAADPNIPNIRILAFYAGTDADRRDQDTVLLDDFVEAATPTGGTSKLSYEFIDPDRNPIVLTDYEAQAGNIVVVALNADGTPNTDKKEIIDPLRLTTDMQTALTNAVLRVSATGDFRAYFLTVQDGIPLTNESGAEESLSILNENMQAFNWNLQTVSFFDLTGTESTVTLNDPLADGEVLIIAGGSAALADEDLQVITNYVEQGGDLMIFADPGDDSLATAANMNAWLTTAFGVSFSPDVVLDQSRNYGSPLIPVVSDFSSAHFATSFFAGGGFVVFTIPHRLTITDTLPTNVSVTELAFSGPDSYTRTYQELLDDQVEPTEGSARGPFVLAVAAENEVTGARVVLFGSRDIANDTLLNLAARGDVYNLDIALRAMVWATEFDSFFLEIPQVEQTLDATQQPIFVTSDQVRTINIITLLLLPFGVLAAGALVWWFSRERPLA